MNTFFLIGIGGWMHDSSLDPVLHSMVPKKVIGAFSSKASLNRAICDCGSVQVHERGTYNYLIVEKIAADKIEAPSTIIDFYKLNGKFNKVKKPKWAKDVRSFLFDR